MAPRIINGTDLGIDHRLTAVPLANGSPLAVELEDVEHVNAGRVRDVATSGMVLAGRVRLWRLRTFDGELPRSLVGRLLRRRSTDGNYGSSASAADVATAGDGSDSDTWYSRSRIAGSLTNDDRP